MATTPGPAAGFAPELLQAVEAPQASVFDCIRLLGPTAGNVALQFRLCQRLQQFPLDQTAFWLPELVHVFVTCETESAALEDALLSLSRRSNHVALSVFWFLQASLSDLKSDPHSSAFVAARRLTNRMQQILFTTGDLPESSVMHENPQPALVLAGMVAASVGMPQLGKHMKPLVELQGRKQRSAYLVRRVVSKITSRSSAPSLGDADIGDIETAALRKRAEMSSQPNLHSVEQPQLRPSSQSTDSLPIRGNSSMPNLRTTNDPQANLLKTNYFRCETQFVYALNAISLRLLQVPKEARQSALQVELALLNEDLPHAEVDLPMLLPQWNGKQNRIVRICTSEATVLNSAEKAPFLLLIEYLRGELTFDPQKPHNREILRSDPKLKTHIFERATLPLEDKTQPAPPREKSPAVNLDVEYSESEVDISEVSLLEREEKGSLSLQSESARWPPQSPMAATELNAAAQVTESRQYAEGPSAADLATQWRTASLILAQLDGSTNLPRQDVQAIRQRIIKSMQDMQKGPSATRGEAGERRLENDLKTSGLAITDEQQPDDDDPSAANLGEDWQARKKRIRKTSKFGHHKNWDLVSVIVKTGDDLRQEALASQLIQRAAQIWKNNGVGVWVRRMMILITSANSGLVETITNALSLHSIKKALSTAQVNEGGDPRSIAQISQHFELKFGPPNSSRYKRSVQNFVESLAGYSVLCYVLQIKDRHNGNILVDAEGHIIHIDFGFMLSNSPGHIGFEANTFKLTQEYVDLMGGVNSEYWALFMELVVQAFLALRKHTDELVSFMHIMGTDSTLPCFNGDPQATARNLRQRLMPDLSEEEIKQTVERMIWKSFGSIYTRIYDQYQMATQGIYN